jgi:hypothetical protein
MDYLTWSIGLHEGSFDPQPYAQFDSKLGAVLCHFEVGKKPYFYLVHNASEDDGGRKNACDDRRFEWRHQYSSKRQRADYQNVQNTRHDHHQTWPRRPETPALAYDIKNSLTIECECDERHRAQRIDVEVHDQ